MEDSTNPHEKDALYIAWMIIANAYEGDWHKATVEWRTAAEHWRDEMFYPLLRNVT